MVSQSFNQREEKNYFSFSLSPVVTVSVGNSSVIEEGESVTVCAEIVSPAEVDREANTLGMLEAGTATGVQSNHPQIPYHGCCGFWEFAVGLS